MRVQEASTLSVFLSCSAAQAFPLCGCVGSHVIIFSGLFFHLVALINSKDHLASLTGACTAGFHTGGGKTECLQHSFLGHHVYSPCFKRTVPSPTRCCRKGCPASDSPAPTQVGLHQGGLSSRPQAAPDRPLSWSGNPDTMLLKTAVVRATLLM